MDFFEKDGPSFLQRDKYHDIIDTIFKNFTRLEKDAIIFQYTDWDHVNDGYLNQKMVGDVVGDYFFICPTNLFAEVAADRGMKIYYYFFTHEYSGRADDFKKIVCGCTAAPDVQILYRSYLTDKVPCFVLDRTSTSLWGEWMGVMHGDEIEYVFGHPLNMSLQFNSRERELSLKMMQAFARFASTGKPVTDDVNWPLYTKEQPQYYIFNADRNGIGRGPRATACAFWNEFLPKLRDNSESAESPCVNTYLSKRDSSSSHRVIPQFLFSVLMLITIILHEV